jgi:hypothetical protein
LCRAAAPPAISPRQADRLHGPDQAGEPGGIAGVARGVNGECVHASTADFRAAILCSARRRPPSRASAGVDGAGRRPADARHGTSLARHVIIRYPWQYWSLGTGQGNGYQYLHRFDEPVAERVGSGFDAAVHAEPAIDARDVVLHRALAQDEMLGDLPVAPSGGEQTQHLEFTR